MSITHDAERAVCCAVLSDPDVLPDVRDIVSLADFTDALCARVFGAVCAVADAGGTIDPLTVLARMGGQPDDKQAVGELLDAVPITTHAEHHARLVKQASDRRRLAATLDRMQAAMSDPAASVSELAEALATEALSLATPAHASGFQKPDVYALLEEIERRGLATRVGQVPGLSTGFRAIDDRTSGFRPGELVVIGGVPKGGKTSFALNVTRHALESGKRVGIVSAEMSRAALTERLLNAAALVRVGDTRAGRLTPEEWGRLAEAARVIHTRELFIDDTALPSLADVQVRSLGLAARVGQLDLLVVDFLQLIRHTLRGRRGDEELTAISYGLKGLARQLGCVVLAPCQLLDKAIAGRADKRPQFTDLAGSSGMMQAADYVALCYRPAMYSPTASPTLEMEWLGRNVEQFTAYLRWDGAHMRIDEQGINRPGGLAA